MLNATPTESKAQNSDDTHVEERTWVEVEQVRSPPNSIVEGGDTTAKVVNFESIATG